MALVVANWEGDFGAVHDSFSAHASKIENLMEDSREVFVEMYDKENFYNTIPFGRGYKGEQPNIGSLDITEVVGSDYFFC
jgi:DNA-directed RNA polymerase